MTASNRFVITREFDASREAVWNAVTEPEAKHKTFEGGRSSMQQGFGGTFDQLAAYLAL